MEYSRCDYGAYFEEFCTRLFEYQYVKNRTNIDDNMLDWLYEHSRGILSNVISPFHDSQEIAILSGKECLTIDIFNEAYKRRMNNLHSYIETQAEIKVVPKVRKRKPKYEEVAVITSEKFTIQEIASRAKKEKLDVVKLLKERINIVEVAI